jgi:mono/diheme cytochrome c family protein
MRGRGLTGLAAALVWIMALQVVRASDGEPQGPVRFERDVRPILAANCAGCHGADRPKAGLDLRSVASILRGGKSGPALNASDPEGSLLLERVAQGEMPPGKARKLSADEISTVRAWVRGGVRIDHPGIAGPTAASPARDEDRQFWSFRPLRRPPVPMGSHSGRIRSPIDLFLLARLESKGLSFSPDADDCTLVRRAYLDLLGLLPSLEEVDTFLADGRPGSFERLVDRLLASPHHGERWGRHWLDVAGYVDTVGFDTDATNIILSEGKWRYRDYVIRALNEDRPYDRFLTEQLAGDELNDWRRAARFTPAIRETLIATGYLRTARDLTHEDVGVIPQNFYGIAHDTIEIVGTGLLGLTIHCARCHDHKFDPIPQEDYYRLMAIFTPAYNPRAWLPVIPTETKSRDR